MKKITLFALVCLALAACTKEQPRKQGVPFEKGQVVVLAVDAASATKVSSELKGDNIDFIWNEGDKILISVGGASAEFTLKEGAGQKSATFEGKMPAAGTLFDVQYPVGTIDLSSQAYSASEALPKDKMLFTDTNCSLDDGTFELTAQSAALKLNLYGDKTISKIEIKNTATSDTYTLNISPAVALSTEKSNAKPFYVVVPAGNYNFSAEIFDGSSTSICKMQPRSAQEIKVGKFLDMPAQEVFTPTTLVNATADYQITGAEIGGDWIKSRMSQLSGWTHSSPSIVSHDTAIKTTYGYDAIALFSSVINNVPDVVNGKVYQTVKLMSGNYRFSLQCVIGALSNSVNAYFVATKDSTLPDIGELKAGTATVLASAEYQHTAPYDVNVDFSLDSNGPVTIGWVYETFSDPVYGWAELYLNNLSLTAN